MYFLSSTSALDVGSTLSNYQKIKSTTAGMTHSSALIACAKQHLIWMRNDTSHLAEVGQDSTNPSPSADSVHDDSCKEVPNTKQIISQKNNQPQRKKTKEQNIFPSKCKQTQQRDAPKSNPTLQPSRIPTTSPPPTPPTLPRQVPKVHVHHKLWRPPPKSRKRSAKDTLPRLRLQVKQRRSVPTPDKVATKEVSDEQ